MTTIWFLNTSLPQKKPHAISTHIPDSLPLRAWQLFTYSLTLWICQFWTFHINSVTQSVLFVSGFFHLTHFFQGSHVSSHGSVVVVQSPAE